MKPDGSKASGGGHGLLHHAGDMNADRGMGILKSKNTVAKEHSQHGGKVPKDGPMGSRAARRAKRLTDPKDRLW